ncbi:MAG: hypothetical protein JPMHGGIA_01359 [Saprospiraceae bacterium]|jgi:hypothetical protein|nr:hypothetical protein [Saprospiraceae bacterium]
MHQQEVCAARCVEVIKPGMHRPGMYIQRKGEGLNRGQIAYIKCRKLILVRLLSIIIQKNVIDDPVFAGPRRQRVSRTTFSGSTTQFRRCAAGTFILLREKRIGNVSGTAAIEGEHVDPKLGNQHVQGNNCYQELLECHFCCKRKNSQLVLITPLF